MPRCWPAWMLGRTAWSRVSREYARTLGIYSSDVGNLQSDVGNLQSDVGGIRSDVGNLQSDVGEIRSDMKVVKGASLESYLHVQMSSRAANLFDLRRISIVRGPLVADPTHNFENSVAKALNEGVIAQTQSDRIFNTDMIVMGQDPKEPSNHIRRC